MDIFHSPYYNCKNLLLTASMEREGVLVNKVWNKAGLHYNPNLRGKISPYYLYLEEEVRSYGFELNILRFNNSKDFLENVYSFLKGNKVIAVYLDIFNLPYSLYFKEIHQKHAIEIYDSDDSDLFICDHYYNYKGKISKITFEKAVNDTLTYLKHELEIFYLQKNNEIKNENIHSIIIQNLNALEGKVSYPKEDDFSVTGIYSIPIFKDVLISELSSKKTVEEKDAIFSEFYPGIKEISFSRYHLHRYIKLLDNETAVRILDASQNWSIIAHLLLMANVSKKYNQVTHRIEKVFNKAFEKEKKYIKNLEVLAEKYSISEV